MLRVQPLMMGITRTPMWRGQGSSARSGGNQVPPKFSLSKKQDVYTMECTGFNGFAHHDIFDRDYIWFYVVRFFFLDRSNIALKVVKANPGFAGFVGNPRRSGQWSFSPSNTILYNMQVLISSIVSQFALDSERVKGKDPSSPLTVPMVQAKRGLKLLLCVIPREPAGIHIYFVKGTS